MRPVPKKADWPKESRPVKPTLADKQQLWLGGRAIHVLKHLEKLFHLRWPRTFEVAKRAVGVIVLLLTAVLVLTRVPLSNVAPAIVISLIPLAYVEEAFCWLPCRNYINWPWVSSGLGSTRWGDAY
jgi:hypothetical protein